MKIPLFFCLCICIISRKTGGTMYLTRRNNLQKLTEIYKSEQKYFKYPKTTDKTYQIVRDLLNNLDVQSEVFPLYELEKIQIEYDYLLDSDYLELQISDDKVWKVYENIEYDDKEYTIPANSESIAVVIQEFLKKIKHSQACF